jgi:hypothetical protein
VLRSCSSKSSTSFLRRSLVRESVGSAPMHGNGGREGARTRLTGTGRIRPLAISKQLASKTQFNGVGRLRTYISFTHSAF